MGVLRCNSIAQILTEKSNTLPLEMTGQGLVLVNPALEHI